MEVPLPEVCDDVYSHWHLADKIAGNRLLLYKVYSVLIFVFNIYHVLRSRVPVI